MDALFRRTPGRRGGLSPFWQALLLILGLAVSRAAEGGGVYRLEMRETVQPVTADYLLRGITEAEKGGAKLVVIEIDTPGGLVDSTRTITTRILESKVPVVVFVSPRGSRAASAGFVILIAADLAAMAPATNTGAAHPVVLGGDDRRPEKGDKTGPSIMFEKMENDMAAMVRSLASTRGRNVELAEKGVRESLSFTEKEALAQNIVDVVAPDVPDLLKQLEGRKVRRPDGSEVVLALAGEPVVPVSMTRIEALFAKLLHPQIVAFLLLAGVVGLGFELTHPGAILPGVVGAISLLLALYALAVLPINFVGVALLLLAGVLIVLEVKITSHGLLGLGGAVALVLGAALLIDSPIPEMRIDWWTFVPTALVIALSLAWMIHRFSTIRSLRPSTGREGMIGVPAEAKSDFLPTAAGLFAGKVFAEGTYWNAESRIAVVAGRNLRVTALRGLVLEVEPAGPDPADRPAGNLSTAS
jgi:membrane-bound serine protease (ClpP class)